MISNLFQKFDFTKLPYHIINEILSLIRNNDICNILSLDRKTFHFLLPIVYREFLLVEPLECPIQFEKYGHLIDDFFISLESYDEVLYEGFMNNIKNYLNPRCHLSLFLFTDISLDHLIILNKFKVVSIEFGTEIDNATLNFNHLQRYFKMLDFLRNVNDLSSTCKGFLIDNEFLNILPSHLKCLKIANFWKKGILIDIDILTKFKQLTILHLICENPIFSILKLFQIYFPNLKRFCLEFPFYHEESEIYEIDGNNYPKLKSFYIAFTFSIRFINTFQRLKGADLVFIKGDKNKSITVNLPHSKELKSLSLFGLDKGQEIELNMELHDTLISEIHQIPFFNISYLQLYLDCLTLKFFKLISKMNKLDVLRMVINRLDHDLFDWLFDEHRDFKLSITYLQLIVADKNGFYLFTFLNEKSPNLAVIDSNFIRKPYFKLEEVEIEGVDYEKLKAKYLK